MCDNTTSKDLPAKETAPSSENSEMNKSYSLPDVIFAWLSIFFGYLFCRAFPVFENTLGSFIFVIILFVTTFIIITVKKIKTPQMALIVGISALVISPALIITNSTFIIFLTHTYILLSYCYFIYSSFENCIEKGVSDYIFIDYIKSILVMPFCSLTKIFKAISQGKAKQGMQVALKILLGLAIAVVPTIVIFCLLSYDGGFISIFESIFDFDASDIFSHIGSLILAIPIGMYIFGLYASSSEKLLQETITSKDCNKGFEVIRIMPQITALTAVLPILFVYIIYFISQWKYYISGFTGILPEDFSYAEYAREGFFQLCAVSIINLIVIMAILLFVRRKNNKTSALIKIITTVFCIFTLILISTAISKLIMYINTYGLTQKRVYAMWLMIVIAIMFIIIAAGRFATRIKTVWMSLAVCVILFAALALSNVNAVIAEYNVDRYLDGTLDIVDLDAMDQLGYSAIPSLVRLANELEERKSNGENIPEEMLEKLTENLEKEAFYIENYENSFFQFNIPAHRAKSAFIKYGLIKE